MVECFLCSIGRVLLSFAISTPLRTVYDNIEMQCSIFQPFPLLSWPNGNIATVFAFQGPFV